MENDFLNHLLIEASDQYIAIYLTYIINNLPHFIFWKDKNSIFQGCNKIFAESVHLTFPSEVVGKSDYEMPWTREESELYIQDDQQIITTGKPKLGYEEYQHQTDGTEKIMLVSKVPMYDGSHNIIGILGIYTDITERKRFEAELIHTKKEMEIANQLKTEFIRQMEHDIRTPFSGILSLANFLELKESIFSKKFMILIRSIDSSIIPQELSKYGTQVAFHFFDLPSLFQ